jgi:Astacin (Peptidase family M12A)
VTVHKKTIQEAMTTIENATCIRFVPRAKQVDYIEFISGGGCYSNIGRIGGVQPVSLSVSGCFAKVGKAMHELIHALGESNLLI